MIDTLVWIASSVVLGLLQYILVTYSAVICVCEIACVGVLKNIRYAVRWITWPWDCARWRMKRRMWHLMLSTRSASSYEEWLAAARELDGLEGGSVWRRTRESDEYDYELIEETTRRLRRARRQKDVMALLFSLRAVMDRQYGGIDRGALYHRARTGTKHLIEAFLQEVGACLESVAESDGLTPEAKHEFFETCRLNVGRTALALSGGGALAMAHMGVVRTLIQAGLLPRVISGTSGGSIVAAMMAMHTDAELLNDVLTPRIVSSRHVRFFEPLPVQLSRFIMSTVRLGAPRMVDTEKFAEAVKAYYRDVTFGEAFARTGRIVNITITISYGGSTSGVSRPLVLNYLTAPSCLLWSAVAASCALPGLMRPVTLLAKDHTGRVVPFHPVAGMHSIDGSMASDIPAEQLALMFHVNRTIVSQTNPHIVPFLKDTGPRARIDSNLLSRALHAAEVWLEMDVKHRAKYLAKMKLLPKFFGAEFNAVFLQRYSGDVTIAPHQSFLSTWRALSQPSESDMRVFILEGQRASWPNIAHIRMLVAIEKRLSACARRFRAQPRGLPSPWGGRSVGTGRASTGPGGKPIRAPSGDGSAERPHHHARAWLDSRVESFAAPADSSMMSAILRPPSVDGIRSAALASPPAPEEVQEVGNLASAGRTVARTPSHGGTGTTSSLHIRAPFGGSSALLYPPGLPSAVSYNDIANLGGGFGGGFGSMSGPSRRHARQGGEPSDRHRIRSTSGSVERPASTSAGHSPSPSHTGMWESASFGSLSPTELMVAAGTRQSALTPLRRRHLPAADSYDSLPPDTQATFLAPAEASHMFEPGNDTADTAEQTVLFRGSASASPVPDALEAGHSDTPPRAPFSNSGSPTTVPHIRTDVMTPIPPVRASPNGHRLEGMNVPDASAQGRSVALSRASGATGGTEDGVTAAGSPASLRTRSVAGSVGGSAAEEAEVGLDMDTAAPTVDVEQAVRERAQQYMAGSLTASPNRDAAAVHFVLNASGSDRIHPRAADAVLPFVAGAIERQRGEAGSVDGASAARGSPQPTAAAPSPAPSAHSGPPPSIHVIPVAARVPDRPILRHAPSRSAMPLARAHMAALLGTELGHGGAMTPPLRPQNAPIAAGQDFYLVPATEALGPAAAPRPVAASRSVRFRTTPLEAARQDKAPSPGEVKGSIGMLAAPSAATVSPPPQLPPVLSRPSESDDNGAGVELPEPVRQAVQWPMTPDWSPTNHTTEAAPAQQ